MHTKLRFYNKITFSVIAVLLLLFTVTGVLVGVINYQSLKDIYETSYSEKVTTANGLISSSLSAAEVGGFTELLSDKAAADADFKARQIAYNENRRELAALEQENGNPTRQAELKSALKAFNGYIEEFKLTLEPGLQDLYKTSVSKLKQFKENGNIEFTYVFADTGLRVMYEGAERVLYTFIFDGNDGGAEGNESGYEGYCLGATSFFESEADAVYSGGKAMDGVLHYDGPYGTLFYAYAPVILAGGGENGADRVVAVVGTEIGLTDMNARLRSSGIITVTVFVSFVIIVCTALILFISLKIISPLKYVTETAQRVADGDVYAQVPERALASGSELGVLARSVKEMGGVFQSLLQSSGRVLSAAKEGKLNARNDPSAFSGDFAVAVKSINDTLDAAVEYLNSLPDAVFIMNSTSLEMNFKNEAYGRSFGDTGAEEFLRKALPGAESFTAEELAAALKAAAAGGPIAWINGACYSVVIKEINGGTGASIVIAKDITALVQEKIHAQSASVAKSEFLSRVSHELRTPMNVILGMTALGLKDETACAGAHERFNKIETASRHLLTIINDVLDMSRIESGKMEIREEAFSLSELISECDCMFRPAAAEKGVAFNIETAPGLPDALRGDPARVKQVLINLLGNSFKFTEAGHITLKTERTGGTEPEPEITFTVADTGIGMSEKFMQNIFNPFEQEAVYLQRKHKGSGLGLPICKNLVGLMGGELTVASKQGEGSLFMVKLTFKTDKEKAEAATQTAKSVPAAAADISGMQVMVVDDIEINRLIFTEMLSDTGIIITEAGDGTEAVRLFEESPENSFGLIFMDVQMVEMDGYEATRRIRASGRSDNNLPIIAMTANALKQDEEAAAAAGMNGHIAKPIDYGVCISIMQKYFRKKR